jgi:hypothetical protein
MAKVDADDDTIRRFVVQHYRYDPDRHERRPVVIAAFDNEAECEASMHEAQAEPTDVGRMAETSTPTNTCRV